MEGYIKSKNNITFKSSTKEGKPPIAMTVKKVATNISIEPLA